MKKLPRRDAFLHELESEAQWQAQLQHVRLLPPFLDRFTALIGNYPWQVLFIISGLTAVVWRMVGG